MIESSLGQDLLDFFSCLGRYFRFRLKQIFRFLERLKSLLAAWLYQQRGRYARPFIHLGMAVLVVGGISLGPVLISEKLRYPWEGESEWSRDFSVSASSGMETATLVSVKPRAEVIEYTVQPGDTVSVIAEKFGVSVDTIRWENNLETVKSIKVGQKIKILPVTGMMHKVKHGETIYSIAKKYQVDAQVIVDWPYNSFANDEIFALAVGQTLIIPDGIKPKEVVAPRYYAQAPTAGTVTGTGQFVWPVGGRITQGFSWYHQAIDIANKAAPDIVAADSGSVVAAGWTSAWGYGNQVVVDHGNGFVTSYSHLSQIYVRAGQAVSRGQAVGKMGSTGRSTGIHLHFEIKRGGVNQNPLNYLK